MSELQLLHSLSPESPEPPKPLSYYAKNLLALALPNTLAIISWTVQGIIGVYFVGLLDNVTFLDAFSLANIWTGIFAFSIVIGLGSGLDTLVSQSFGQEDYRMCGIHLYRGFIVVTIASTPSYAFLLFSDKLYQLIGIDAEVSAHAYKCVIAFIPAIVLQIPLTMLEKFMFGQRIAKPQMIIQLINTLFYPAYCYVFVFVLGMGYFGAPAARAFAALMYILGMVVYLCVSKCCSRTFVAPTKEIYEGWGSYFSLALPTMLMICLEWWGCSSMSVLCARLGIVDLAAHTITANYAQVIFFSCLGIGCATGTLVGNSIGEKNIMNAKIYSLLGPVLAACILGLFAIPFLLLRHQLSRLFTTNIDVVEKLEILLIIVLFTQLFDGLQVTLGKALIGMGKQVYASLVNLASYYALMIPVGIVLGYVLNYGVIGVWIALTLGSFTAAIGFTILMLRQNWERLVEEAELRAIENNKEVKL